MFNRGERVFAVVLLIVCVLVSIAGYSAWRKTSPPNRVWFDASAGDVIFDHAYHTTFTECADCHHNFGEEGAEMNCRACHYYGEAREFKSDNPNHPRFIGASCVACHKEDEMDVSCNTCHVQRSLAFERSGRVPPPLPKKVTFDTDNGRVVFDHTIHIGEDVDASCVSCHHECVGGKEMKGMPCQMKCRACHYELQDKIPESGDEYHVRYIGLSCTSCHGEKDCGECHQEQ
jgi:hypothetical protein